MPDRQSGRSSGVEHNLAKVGVEGSNPFARSIFFLDELQISTAHTGTRTMRGLELCAAYESAACQPRDKSRKTIIACPVVGRIRCQLRRKTAMGLA